jgi:hypothetical protein
MRVTRAVRGRVAEDHVLVVLGQPQGFGQGEGEDAPVALVLEDTLDQVAAADRLAGQADGGAAARAVYEIAGVGVEGVEVHHGERRVQVLGGPLQLGHPDFAEAGHGGGGRFHVRPGRHMCAHIRTFPW